MHELIGLRVMHRTTKRRGRIKNIIDKTMDGSRINLMSAMMCVKIAEMFAGEYDVGIITPYMERLNHISI